MKLFAEPNQIEKKILRFLWENGKSASKEIRSGIEGKVMAFPTVSLALRLLVLKGILTIE